MTRTAILLQFVGRIHLQSEFFFDGIERGFEGAGEVEAGGEDVAAAAELLGDSSNVNRTHAAQGDLEESPRNSAAAATSLPPASISPAPSKTPSTPSKTNSPGKYNPPTNRKHSCVSTAITMAGFLSSRVSSIWYPLSRIKKENLRKKPGIVKLISVLFISGRESGKNKRSVI